MKSITLFLHTQSTHRAICLLAALLFSNPCQASGDGDRVNPFVRPPDEHVNHAPSNAATPELQLRAVSPTGKAPLANINGKVLSVGEKYMDFKITHIAKDHVTVNKNDHTIKLYLWQAEE